MPQEVQLNDVEKNIGELIQKAIHGNEITIVMGDKPVATLSPFIKKNMQESLERLKGR